MPLVIITGIPSSGKTKRSQEIANYFENTLKKKCIIVNDDSGNHSTIDKNALYSSDRLEKESRGRLKSEMMRLLNKETIVILDSLNYIKGYRYELYCAAKSIKNNQIVIHCDVMPEITWQWNELRENSNKYTKEVFDALVMRYEEPDSRNRWDSPLFTVFKDDELNLKAIEESLFLKKPPPPNQSTQNAPLSASNFLHELDVITQNIVKNILDIQKTAVPGDEFLINGSSEKLKLIKILRMPELTRIRRQFISFTKSHPVDDTKKLSNMFVQYINSSLEGFQ